MEDVFQVIWLILVRFTVTAFLGPHLRDSSGDNVGRRNRVLRYKLRKHLQGRQLGRVDTVHMRGCSLWRAVYCGHFMWFPLRLSHLLISAVTSESAWNQTLVGTLSLNSGTRSFPSVPLSSKCGQKQWESQWLVLFSSSQSKSLTERNTKL